MQRNGSPHIRALALATGLIGWKGLVALRLSPPWHLGAHLLLSTMLVASARPPLGLRPPAVYHGLRVGGTAAAVVVSGVSVGTGLPPVRVALAEWTLPAAAGRWLLVRIPLGTVWSEETAFRGALGSLGAAAFGPTGGQLLQAVTFGLSHIADARAARQPVLPTVAATGLAGWVFGRLYERTGSLAAPMLAHLAINGSGALAALAVQRRNRLPQR